jgi:hypothetical protein
MAAQKFSATIEKSGSKNFLVIPFDPDQEWGSKERYHITGFINGHRIRGPLTREGSRYILTLGEAWRRDSGLEAGAAVLLDLMPEGPQMEGMAPDLVAALEIEPQARIFFEALATFYRKNYLRWLDGAKKPETRAVRIAELIELLKAGKKQR